MAKGRHYIGIAGWTYAPWRGTFYPDTVTQKKELEYASRAVNSIEINGTFYSLQRPPSFQNWYDATPPGFVFAVKGHQFITHRRRLKNVEEPVGSFFAQGLFLLGEKLGPILWQLPPNMKFDADAMRSFLDLLPHDFDSAAKAAQKCSPRIRERAVFDPGPRSKRPIRHAIEVRHESFRDAKFVELLREHNVALVVADTANKWPAMEDVTSDFVYVRLHGHEELYVSGYTDKGLDEWAKRIEAWLAGKEPEDAKRVGPAAPNRKGGRDVYVYFDNDVKVRSPFDAIALAWRLNGMKGEKQKLPDLSHVHEKARTAWPVGKKEGRPAVISEEGSAW